MSDPKRGGGDPSQTGDVPKKLKLLEQLAKDTGKLTGIVTPEHEVKAEEFNKSRSIIKRIFGSGSTSAVEIATKEARVISQKEQERIKQEQEKIKAEQDRQKKIEEQEAKERARAVEIFKKSAEYTERIKAGDNNVIQELCEAFGYSEGDFEYLLQQFFSFSKLLDEYPKTTELVEAITELWTTSDRGDLSHWMHSVCHTIEKYHQFIMDDEKVDSFLNDERWNKATEIIIKEALSRTANVKEYPLSDRHSRINLKRIFYPLIIFNLDNVDVNNLDIFPLKPTHSDYSVVADQLRDNEENKTDLHNKIMEEFFRTDSPKDFVIKIVKLGGAKLPVRKYEKAMSLLGAVKDDVPQELMTEYINHFYPVNGVPTNLETIQENIEKAEEAKETVSGLFVDVDGTLISPNGDSINKKILEHMKSAVKEGKTVVVFTGGSPELVSEKLKALGVPEQFLHVKSKGEYQGKILESLIDDTSPVLQGFKAKSWIKPHQLN